MKTKQDEMSNNASCSVTLTCQNGERFVVAGITKCHTSAGFQRQSLDVVLRDVEGDGHGEKVTTCEAQGINDAIPKQLSI